MLLQNLKRRYLYVVIRLPKFKDLEQKIPTFLNCDNYGIHRPSNPNPTCDDIKLNDNALHQQICTCFNVDYLVEMDIMGPYWLFYLIKLFKLQRGQQPLRVAIAGQLHFGYGQKRAIPVMAILQAGVAIGGTLIKGINALVNVKRAKSLNNTLKMVATNVELTHQSSEIKADRCKMIVTFDTL